MKGLLSITSIVHLLRVCMAVKIKITITFRLMLFKTWVKIVHMLGVYIWVKISPLQWIKTLGKTCLLLGVKIWIKVMEFTIHLISQN